MRRYVPMTEHIISALREAPTPLTFEELVDVVEEKSGTRPNIKSVYNLVGILQNAGIVKSIRGAIEGDARLCVLVLTEEYE